MERPESTLYEEPASQDCSTQDVELRARVWRWLEESPDFRPKEDLFVSNSRVSFRTSASFTSHLEDWEDESLHEALKQQNHLSSVLSCFRGIFRKFK